jgi:uncharacterized membrane protein YeaQ/YmgE (transglycosylase-associated protein family)
MPFILSLSEFLGDVGCCSFLGPAPISLFWLISGWGNGSVDFWVTLFMMACIGAASGWYASIVLHGEGMGIVGNMVVGFLGAFVGRWLFDYLRIPPISNWSYMGHFIYGLVGSFILLLVFGRFFIQKDSR